MDVKLRPSGKSQDKLHPSRPNRWLWDRTLIEIFSNRKWLSAKLVKRGHALKIPDRDLADRLSAPTDCRSSALQQIVGVAKRENGKLKKQNSEFLQ